MINDEYFDDLVEKCDSETKLAVTRWVMKHIVEHAQNGGSYRYLIYHRLGFDVSAYVPLCQDGLTISNEFDLNDNENIKEVFRVVLQDQEGDLDFIKYRLEKLKKNFGICDEPGCCDPITSGTPTDAGYRSTCSKHRPKIGVDI